MQNVKRVFITVVAFALAIIYSIPNLALFFAIGTVAINKWIAGIACFVFAWNIAKLVESAYRRYLDEDKREQPQSVVSGKEVEWVEGEGYSYYIKDDEITFQFRNIKDHDGRQLNRLKFMREKFFKDK